MGYAPPAIQALFDTVKERMPSAQLGGIYGTKPGYHNCRADLPPSDYSVQTGPDKEGDPQAGAALDITYGRPEEQHAASQRLMNAKTDPRTDCLREFFGSVDGVNVCGWDFHGGYPVTSDDSHLWHVHLSFLRKHATNGPMLQELADVITGISSSDQPKGDTMPEIVTVRRSAPMTLHAGQAVELKFDAQDDDSGDVFYGEGKPGAGEQGARLNLDGARFVSTFTGKVPDGVTLSVRFAWCDRDGDTTGTSAWADHSGELVDTRAARVGEDNGVKLSVKADADCELKGAQWRVLYWRT